ncbi:hypothetical protein BKA64DRAFT_85556 [Cadophora sp. MPI-SDFR-AT-0126]|nr:hypothetical protein BKA64DRAFT_85556 [Leotiomycetes sp. MPI-SDFR-AT-0126]
MAEILGVISGIVAIADAGFKLYLALSNTASALGSAGNEILLFSSEVRIFAEILVVVRANLKDHSLRTSRSDILDKAIGVIPGLIMQCEMVYASMENILKRLQPYKDSMFRLKSKVMWMKDKAKMLELRGFLEPLKSSLQLLLSLIKNEIADNNHEPTAIRNILREELTTAFRESKSQPASLDEGLLDPDGTQIQVTRVEQALVIRSKPMQTIKEAAEAMIALHHTSSGFEPDPRHGGDSNNARGKKRPAGDESTKETSSAPQTSNEAIKKYNLLVDDVSRASLSATNGDAESDAWSRNKCGSFGWVEEEKWTEEDNTPDTQNRDDDLLPNPISDISFPDTSHLVPLVSTDEPTTSPGFLNDIPVSFDMENGGHGLDRDPLSRPLVTRDALKAHTQQEEMKRLKSKRERNTLMELYIEHGLEYVRDQFSPFSDDLSRSESGAEAESGSGSAGVSSKKRRI